MERERRLRYLSTQWPRVCQRRSELFQTKSGIEMEMKKEGKQVGGEGTEEQEKNEYGRSSNQEH